ncbi:hypothetical protein INR49_019211 [Caranx melampygus]|nr:hypothetical protein INR49_019211 [Caranx melampygus]
MKRGTLNFLGRKNQNLFDTNIKMRDMGFAVPTPTVPILPPASDPKANGSVGGDSLSNGSVISVPDLEEGEIFVPPPPSMAPPPPPGPFIPPPDFFGDLNSPDLAIKPPSMAPPPPPSTLSTGSTSSTSSPIANVPQHPKFAPPLPPTEKQHKTHKTPPPKPIRLSSMSNIDSPPQTPAPPPPVQTPTLSTFNPQNTAKLYDVPKSSPLSSQKSQDTKPKQMLLLEDSGSVNSTPVLVQVDGKVPNVATPTIPDSKELKEKFQITKPSHPPPPEPNKEAKSAASTQQEITKLPQTTPQKSPQLPQVNSSQVSSEPSEEKLEVSPRPQFSQLLDCKLRNLKSSETSGTRDGPVASPLALLMAAKERDKLRSTHSLSRENSAKKNELPSSSIHPSDSNPNSFVVVPGSNSSSSSSLSLQPRIQEESPCSNGPVEHTQMIQTPEKSSSPAVVRDQVPSNSPSLSKITAAVTNPAEQRRDAKQSPLKTQPEDNKADIISMPLLPPPPEFDDLDEIMVPPPSVHPPDPPVKKAPTPPVTLPPQAPSPPPKPKPAAAPQLSPPDTDVKPRPQVQTKPQIAPTQPPSNLSASQATLLSILQKKMLEMDHKMAPTKVAESSDDWEAPSSNEHSKVPVVPRAPPQSKTNPVVNKAAALDMRELENKVAQKYQETSSLKNPIRGGAGSGSSSGSVHCVMQDDVIPAYGCQGVGATVEPTHTFDKVLVSPISESAAEDMTVQPAVHAASDSTACSCDGLTVVTMSSCSCLVKQFTSSRSSSASSQSSRAPAQDREFKLRTRASPVHKVQ